MKTITLTKHPNRGITVTIIAAQILKFESYQNVKKEHTLSKIFLLNNTSITVIESADAINELLSRV
jgi:hypothetical protein